MMQAAGAAGPDPVILNLGCGTGSTLRALAPHLPPHTQWRLADNDPDLLDAAGAEASGCTSRNLMDLRDLDARPLQEVTLVTASELLDLMPACWVEALALRLA